jgi:hypothetical protein
MTFCRCIAEVRVRGKNEMSQLDAFGDRVASRLLASHTWLSPSHYYAMLGQAALPNAAGRGTAGRRFGIAA